VFDDHLGPSDELSERKLAELYEQLGPGDGGTRFFVAQVRNVARGRRLAMIEQPNPLSLTRQWQLLGLSRATLYHRPVEVSVEELERWRSSTVNICARHSMARGE
jgi:hypothetical protein